MVTIHYYQEGDFKKLYDLMDHWQYNFSFTEEEFLNSIKRIQENPFSKILLAKHENEVVGYAHILHTSYLGLPPSLEVIHLLVSNHFRSKGIGKALMQAVEVEAQKMDVKIVKLSSQLHRSRAHVFYEKLGFTLFKVSKFYEKKLPENGIEEKLFY